MFFLFYYWEGNKDYKEHFETTNNKQFKKENQIHLSSLSETAVSFNMS